MINETIRLCRGVHSLHTLRETRRGVLRMLFGKPGVATVVCGLILLIKCVVIIIGQATVRDNILMCH